MNKYIKYLLGAAALIGAGYAVAQTYAPSSVATVGTADLIPIIPGGGNGSVPSQFVKPSQIAGVPAYVNGGTIVTSATIQFANGQTNWFGHAAGTLALVTPTTAANPSDGQRECVWLDQTITSLAWTANTGQTIGANVVSAGTAKVPNCITYSAATTTWYSSP